MKQRAAKRIPSPASPRRGLRPLLTAGVLSLCLAPAALSLPPARGARELRADQLLPEALAVIFSGQERLRYEVSWSAGVKIGEVDMTITPAKDGAHLIRARVVSSGPLESFYPVNDTFECLVSGPLKLPRLYTVEQVEGKKRKKTTRVTRYNQEAKVVKYRKNQQAEELFSMTGTAYNEFASFVISRALKFEGGSAIVPTFADKRRHEVLVKLLARERKQGPFGETPVLKMQPVMRFKGAYDKSGKTILWVTDDACRVPVEVRSRIAVGALVARLVGYSNPACPRPGRGTAGGE